MNLDDIKNLIKSGQIKTNSNVIDEGVLIAHTSKQEVPCKIYHGWNIVSSQECDVKWGQSNIELFEYIQEQNFDDNKLAEVLDSIQTEDFHWSWFKKSVGAMGDEYEWFYLYAEGEPQAVCLIRHPKDSALEDSNIFYVEFIAVAPWNRSCLVREREFLGVGSFLLRAALNFSVNRLGLSPGFSLHSLPQASEYYAKLKMVNVAEKNKDSLLYFEMPGCEANKLLGVA
ncbi:hypothetical protein [Sessilibacter corallicola]|uniref:hypothetical protein n=1 Tax=Sessilibacter corallicola TaxID=2904075 RepID=UPI0033413606